MPRKTIHTAKLTCTSVAKHTGGVEGVTFQTEPGDALFAPDAKQPGILTFSVQLKAGQDKFEVDGKYELTFVSVTGG